MVCAVFTGLCLDFVEAPAGPDGDGNAVAGQGASDRHDSAIPHDYALLGGRGEVGVAQQFPDDDLLGCVDVGRVIAVTKVDVGLPLVGQQVGVTPDGRGFKIDVL